MMPENRRSGPQCPWSQIPDYQNCAHTPVSVSLLPGPEPVVSSLFVRPARLDVDRVSHLTEESLHHVAIFKDVVQRVHSDDVGQLEIPPITSYADVKG